MPIGVPKVPYRLPGEEDAVFVDIYNLLYRERVLFLAQSVNDEISNQLVGVMIYLNAEDEAKEMCMFINSPGGSVLAGLAIFDVIDYIESDMTTVSMGMAMSMGSFILAGGTMGKRIALPHSRIMIHQPSSAYYDGQAGEFLMESGEVLKIRDKLTRIYAKRTGQGVRKLSADLERDVFMSAQEAYHYGLVDEVVVAGQPIPKIDRLEGMLEEPERPSAVRKPALVGTPA